MADKTYAGLDKARIEELVAERIAKAYLDTLGPNRLEDQARMLADRLANRTALHLADRFFDGTDKSTTTSTFAEQVVQASAKLLVKTQKEAAREEERRKLVKAIRSPTVSHVLEELRGLVALEKEGKLRNARVPLLTLAFQEFGSYRAVLQQVESGPLAA